MLNKIGIILTILCICFSAWEQNINAVLAWCVVLVMDIRNILNGYG